MDSTPEKLRVVLYAIERERGQVTLGFKVLKDKDVVLREVLRAPTMPREDELVKLAKGLRKRAGSISSNVDREIGPGEG